MGYEDRFADRQKRNYGNIYKKPFRTARSGSSKNYNVTHSDASNATENKHSIDSNKYFKLNKPKKKFEFSKYHNMSKKALYNYQIEECRKGLIMDALNQIGNISHLIKNSDEKDVLKCKIEEIKEFIQYHKIDDETVLKKQKSMMNSFREKFK